MSNRKFWGEAGGGDLPKCTNNQKLVPRKLRNALDRHIQLGGEGNCGRCYHWTRTCGEDDAVEEQKCEGGLAFPCWPELEFISECLKNRESSVLQVDR
jgi:hypothetical protein